MRAVVEGGGGNPDRLMRVDMENLRQWESEAEILNVVDLIKIDTVRQQSNQCSRNTEVER